MEEPRTLWKTPRYKGYLEVVTGHPIYRGPCAFEHRACPFCDSKEVEWHGGMSTLLGGSPDPNHHWDQGSCLSCDCTFSRQHVVSQNATWYVNKDRLLVLGEVGCVCQTSRLPCVCGEQLHKILMEGRTGEPKPLPKQSLPNDGTAIQTRMYSSAEPWTSDWVRWSCPQCGIRHDEKPYDTGEPQKPFPNALEAKRTLEDGFVYVPYKPILREQIREAIANEPEPRKPRRTQYAKNLLRPDYYTTLAVGSLDKSKIFGEDEGDSDG